MLGFDPPRLHFILQNGARVATPSKPPKPKPGERDEPVKIDLDHDVAIRALVQVNPKEVEPKPESDPQV